jgi:hypothetical protein
VAGTVIAAGGVLLVLAWVAWRYGPTISRVWGFGCWAIGWVLASQGAIGLSIAFLLWGGVSWAIGTAWYSRRRGYWPSAISARLFTLAARGSVRRPSSAEPLNRSAATVITLRRGRQ